MSPGERSPLPKLIVVTGAPGSGKTTLAHTLAPRIRCPVISRDEIKEGFLNTTGQFGPSDNEMALGVYELFFDVVRLLITRQITLIAEAAFQHKLWAPKLEVLRELASIRIIVCNITPELARLRCFQRHVADPVREQFHPGPPAESQERGEGRSRGIYDPPHLDVPTLTVDTSNGYTPDLDSVIAFVRG